MYPMLDWFWLNVYDAGPTSTQHWKLFILSGRHIHFRSNPIRSNDIHDTDCIPDNHTEQRYINHSRKYETLSGFCLNVGGPTLKHYWFNVVSAWLGLRQRRWSNIETTLVQGVSVNKKRISFSCAHTIKTSWHNLLQILSKDVRYFGPRCISIYPLYKLHLFLTLSAREPYLDVRFSRLETSDSDV